MIEWCFVAHGARPDGLTAPTTASASRTSPFDGGCLRVRNYTSDADNILSPGSTLRHQISTLSRHYPDTIPTLPRHPDTPTPVSIDTRPDTPTPVSGQCKAILTLDIIGQRQAVSMVSKQNRHSDTRHPRDPRHPDTRHPRHSDTTGLDANEVQASMLTGLMMSRCLVCGKCVRGITHVHSPLILSCRVSP